jgi:hypothetical protein
MTFKGIQGYEELYEVSECGKVKSLPRYRTWGNVRYLTQERFLKQRLHNGYLRVNLCGNVVGKMWTIEVHLLVINAFQEKIEGKNFANHKDLDKTNNHNSNLEWTTNPENLVHAIMLKGNKKSKYPNVTRSCSKGSYMARMKLNKKQHHLGSYPTEEEAYQAVLNFMAKNNIINKYI